MYFDRDDIQAAHYAFATAYHGGARTVLFHRMQRITQAPFFFRPGPALSKNARAIYDRLVAKHQNTDTHCEG